MGGAYTSGLSKSVTEIFAISPEIAVKKSFSPAI